LKLFYDFVTYFFILTLQSLVGVCCGGSEGGEGKEECGGKEQREEFFEEGFLHCKITPNHVLCFMFCAVLHMCSMQSIGYNSIEQHETHRLKYYYLIFTSL